MKTKKVLEKGIISAIESSGDKTIMERPFFSVKENGKISDEIPIKEAAEDVIGKWENHERKLMIFLLFCAIYFLSIIWGA